VSTLAVAMGLVAIVLTVGVTQDGGPAPASGAAAWVERERPAGAVLTIEDWADGLVDGNRLRVITASDEDLGQVAVGADVGSVVVPSDPDVVAQVRAAGDWRVTYSDDTATVLVHEGALPVEGAT
jgi:hypothetical protein